MGEGSQHGGEAAEEHGQQPGQSAHTAAWTGLGGSCATNAPSPHHVMASTSNTATTM